MLDAILMAFFGFLYGTYVQYFNQAAEINGKKERPDAVPYISQVCKWVYKLIFIANVLICTNLIILFSSEHYYKSWTHLLNGAGILFFAICITGICRHLARTLNI
jgi:hypothetical protein